MRITFFSALLLIGCGDSQWIDGHWTITGTEAGWLDLYQSGQEVFGTYAWGRLNGSVEGHIDPLAEPLRPEKGYTVHFSLENPMSGLIGYPGSRIQVTAQTTDSLRHLVGSSGAAIFDATKD